MTTIAWRDGVLAADSRGTGSGWIVSETDRKVFRFPDGRLVAITGDAHETWPFMRWLRGGMKGERPKLADAAVIVVESARRITIYKDGGEYPEDARRFHAWGSGWPAARAAMYAGADAIKAVKIAARLDNNTNARVRFLSLDRRGRSLLSDLGA